jgi:hypothetical protein
MKIRIYVYSGNISPASINLPFVETNINGKISCGVLTNTVNTTGSKRFKSTEKLSGPALD